MEYLYTVSRADYQLCVSRESLGRQTMKINAVFVFSTLFISLTQKNKT